MTLCYLHSFSVDLLAHVVCPSFGWSSSAVKVYEKEINIYNPAQRLWSILAKCPTYYYWYFISLPAPQILVFCLMQSFNYIPTRINPSINYSNNPLCKLNFSAEYTAKVVVFISLVKTQNLQLFFKKKPSFLDGDGFSVIRGLNR